MKKLICIITSAMLLCGLSACSGRHYAVITAADGEALADYNGTLELYDAAYSAYAKYALAEAADIIAAQNGIAPTEALTIIQTEEMRIETAGIPALILSAKETGASFFSGTNTNYAIAVTDDRAALTSIYAADGDVPDTYAGSAIKPLSVYAPCMEKGILNWSSVQPDKPVKTLPDDQGGGEWPVNGTGQYSEKNVAAADALAQSLNTVAVRWLQAYGAQNAISFLEETFHMNLERERSIAAIAGDDEVLGNVALGYLQNGVSVCDMAGYYRIFADGGYYTPAFSVTKITANGNTLYEADPRTTRAISEETAYIMNKMLRGVVEKGTGTAANIEGQPIVGKTGTSDEHADNWFIGVTPVNTVAVWHGEGGNNRAAALFAEYYQNASLQTDEAFPVCDTVQEGIYCPESGLLVSERCPGIALGYYKAGELPAICNIH